MLWLNCNSVIVFVYIALVVQLICVLSYRPTRYHSQRLQLPFRIHRSHGEDVSPLRDNGIIKTILTPGDKAKGSPVYGDIVTICLERFDMNGNLIALPDSESMDDYKVTFGIGQDANIFLGIHYGVLSMYAGEVARLDISSAFAVPTIPKNISCRVTLLSVQSVAQLEDDERLTLTDNDNEDLSGKDSEVYQDFKSKIEENGGDNPLATEVFNMRRESRNQKVPKYYDPSRHKLDPNRDLSGSGIDHTWYETVDTMEVYVPLPSVITSKNEISVVIKKKEISIERVDKTGEPRLENSKNKIVLAGPLHGFVNPSGSNWAIEENIGGLFMKGLKIVLNLQKAYGHQDLWGSVFNRQYLARSRDN